MMKKRMSTCRALAERYASETGNQIPTSDASTDIKQAWLLTQEWGCLNSTTGNYETGTTCIENNNAQYPINSSESTLPNRAPVFNYLKEDGFLAWVNTRGFQCVNRIIGNFYGLNYKTGNLNQPGPSVTPPQPQCYLACQNFTSDSTICLECVNQVLTTNPSLCPDVNTTNPQDESLIQDSIACHECIGLQASELSVDPTPTQEQQDAVINSMWDCITGTVSTPLSLGAIIGIIVAVIVVVVTALILGIYFGVIEPKLKKKEKEESQLKAAGVNLQET